MPEEQVEFDFMGEAIKTASPFFHSEKVPATHLYMAMVNAVRALDVLDLMRKAIFYEGRSYDDMSLVGIPEDRSGLFVRDYPQGLSPKLIHAILGAATEGGEKLDLLVRAFDGEPFDRVGYIEEVGDGLWYDANGLHDQGTTMEATMRTNIDKLRKARTGDVFDKTSFNERDLITERKVLEQSVTKSSDPDKVKVQKQP